MEAPFYYEINIQTNFLNNQTVEMEILPPGQLNKIPKFNFSKENSQNCNFEGKLIFRLDEINFNNDLSEMDLIQKINFSGEIISKDCFINLEIKAEWNPKRIH